MTTVARRPEDAAPPRGPAGRSPRRGGRRSPTHDEPAPSRRDRTAERHRRLRVARTAASLTVLAAAVELVILEHGHLERSAGRLADVRGPWLVLAVSAELGSMVAMGRLQQRLLRAGGARLSLATTSAITTAADAVTGTLPGGVAWAAAWLYGQLGRRGVPRFVRVWTFLVAGGVSSFALFLVVATGVEVAGARGPVSSLRWPAFLLALVPAGALAVAVVARRRRGRHMVTDAADALERHLPGGRRAMTVGRSLARRVTAVHLGAAGWLEVLGLALANWLLDCLVVVATMEALGVALPWRAVLVIYGLTQISASLPLTPGGLVVVEGSLTALLVGYGVPLDHALAVVLLYRLVSFWALLPAGWGLWAALDLARRPARGGTRRRRATRARVPSPGAARGTRRVCPSGSTRVAGRRLREAPHTAVADGRRSLLQGAADGR